MIGQPLLRRSRRTALPSLFSVVVAAAAVVSLPLAGATPDDEPTPPPPTLVTGGDLPKPLIRYEISGIGIARHITYQTTNGQQHVADAPLPWSTELTGKMGNRGHTNPYSVSAQGVGPGSISCTLTVNGTVVSQYTATGNPARVVCSHN